MKSNNLAVNSFHHKFLFRRVVSRPSPPVSEINVVKETVLNHRIIKIRISLKNMEAYFRLIGE